MPRHFLIRPSLPSHTIDRPALLNRVDELVNASRVTLVISSAGFGKTATLTAWSARTPAKVAWLALTRADRHPEQLRRSLTAALHHLSAELDRADLSAPVKSWPVLVIDDLHLLDSPAALEVLAPWVEQASLPLRLVLTSRFEPPMALSRLAASGELARLSAAELAMTEEEVGQAAVAIGRELDHNQIVQLHRRTGGWPVAVRLALMSDSLAALPPAPLAANEDFPQFVDYLVENILAQLPPKLREFVPQACTCDWLTGEVAAGLTGEPRGAELLEMALQIGLPLNRHDLPGRPPVYRWHPVMAQAGRAMLMRRAPERARELHRQAARLLTDSDPYEAASHALLGNDPQMATDLLCSRWLAGVLRGNSELVNELCTHLPAPYGDDPEILTIRALCSRNHGQAADASRLADQAATAARQATAAKQAQYEVTRVLAQLFLADLEPALRQACEEVQELLDQRRLREGVLQACAVFLLGWSRLRLRQVDLALPLLREAVLKCRAEGLDELVNRAISHQAFALAFSGDFAGAREALATSEEFVHDSHWRRADGAIEAFTRGWIWFWSGDLKRATPAFREAVQAGGSVTSFAPLARVWLSYSAFELGDPELMAEAEQVLAALPDETVQALPWRAYKLIGGAGLRLAAGDVSGAGAMLEAAMHGIAFIPASEALAARLYLLCGEAGLARQLVDSLAEPLAPYVRVEQLVVQATCEAKSGHGETAHELLEEALAMAAPEGLLHAFQLPDADLVRLMLEHSSRGSREQALLAAALACHGGEVPPSAAESKLSSRESEILGHLATTLTANEICERLFISPNTLKTHLRSIYRKLGVANRREAVRAFRDRMRPGFG